MKNHKLTLHNQTHNHIQPHNQTRIQTHQSQIQKQPHNQTHIQKHPHREFNIKKSETHVDTNKKKIFKDNNITIQRESWTIHDDERYRVNTRDIEKIILYIISIPLLFFILIGLIHILIEPIFNHRIISSAEHFVLYIMVIVYFILHFASAMGMS